MENHQLINQTSGKHEYYTPQAIIEAARRTMNGITLDPFSSQSGNTRVGAERYYGIDDDGFTQEWNARSVWMNHPFSRDNNPRAINKLLGCYYEGLINEACCITFASTSEKWFGPLMLHPQCWLSPRTNYILPDGSIKRGVTKGSVVTYLGMRPESFSQHFRHLGTIK